MMKAGIDSLSFYTPPFYLDLADLAGARGLELDKFYVGIGQERMSVLPPDEDIVTLAANAARVALENEDKSRIKALLFATESGIDQSKSAGIFVHRLLALPDDCRIIELKQACYGGTFALHTARMMVLEDPESKVLVIGSDNARYDRHSPGEATQGCGAVAMIVSARPKIMELNANSAVLTGDVMDFWRPNYSSSAIVDGQYSTRVYLNALQECIRRYQHNVAGTVQELSFLLFHLPFTRIAEKALKMLFRQNPGELKKHIEHVKSSLIYNRLIGNSYTASLYIALCSLLDHSECDLGDKTVGLFSFGSGFSAEFFSGRLLNGYHKYLKSGQHKDMVKKRVALSYQQYLDFYDYKLPEDGSRYHVKHYTTGYFRFAGVEEHKRLYETNGTYDTAAKALAESG